MEYFAAKLKTPTTVISNTVSFLPRSTQESGFQTKKEKEKEKRKKTKNKKQKVKVI